MRIIRFYLPNNGPRLGLLEDNGMVLDLTLLSGEKITSFKTLLNESKLTGKFPYEIINIYLNIDGAEQYYRYDDLFQAEDPEGPKLLIPIEPPEVWAAGVTYKRSIEARRSESQVRDVYDLVYSAERPEIFFKATGARVVGPGDEIGIRSDSQWMVPEPELGVVIGHDRNVVGYIIGNDVSSRDLEGENPLYLPQAKIFRNSCALGPILALTDEVADPYDLNIKCDIYRNNALIFSSTSNTNQLKRTIAELIEYLSRDNIVFPETVLLTGTCIVPPDTFSLSQGDVVSISIDHLGTLSNQVA